MSHEITIREKGKAEMAYTGATSEIWHGLGQQLAEGQTIEQWKVAAGMEWEALESPIFYNSMAERFAFPDRKALFRSDSKAALGIVGTDYKIVQPDEVLEFFDDLTRLNGMRLSTAGTIFGGKRFWALAEMNKEAEIVKGDNIKSYLLLTTSVDGSMSTQARVTSTRVVCQNTLNMALSGASKNAIKITHKKAFDPKEVKLNMGLIDAGWNTFIDNLKALSAIKMDETATRAFYEKKFYKDGVAEEKQPLGNIRTVEALMVRAFNGVGSEMTRGTAWGALNGVTELFTHGTANSRVNPSTKFWESYIGENAKIKNEVMEDLLEMV